MLGNDGGARRAEQSYAQMQERSARTTSRGISLSENQQPRRLTGGMKFTIAIEPGTKETASYAQSHGKTRSGFLTEAALEAMRK